MKLQCRPCKDTLALVKKNAYGKDELVSKKIIPKNVYDGIKDKVIAKQK